MASLLTDFGQQNMARLSRSRVAAAAGVLAVVLVLQFFFPASHFLPLALLLLLESVHGIVVLALEPRVSPRLLLQVSLVLDTTFLCGLVQVTGGVSSGLISLYVWVVFAAGMMLGTAAVPRFVLLVFCAFFLNLELGEIAVAPPTFGRLTLLATAAAQFLLLVILTMLVYFLARFRQQSVERMEEEKGQLAADRAAAEQAAGDLDLLFQAERATTSTLELDEVIDRLLEQMVRTFGVTSASFNSVDEQGQIFRIEQEFFAEAASPRERSTRIRTHNLKEFPRVTKMLQMGTDVSQIQDRDLTPSELRIMEEADAKTVLRVPLHSPDRLLGYIALRDSRAPLNWTDRELRLVEAMAAHASSAIRNAQSYEEVRGRTRELEALYAASQLLNSTLSVGDICRVGVDALKEHLGYYHVSVYFLAGEQLVLQFARGYPQLLPDMPITKGIIGRAARTRQPILASDVSADPDYLAGISGIESEIAVPLLRQDRTLGVLNVETLQPHRLNDADLRVLTTFANQLVVAIDNARLFEETQQRLAELDTLHRAGRALNADLAQEGVLKRVADYFISVLGVDSCRICSWDENRRQFQVLLHRDPELGGRPEIGGSLILSGIGYGSSPLAEPQVQVYSLDKDELLPEVRAVLEKYRFSDVIVLPLLSKGRLVGAIELGVRGRPREFAADRLRVAESLASQAAIAIENARLYADAALRLKETQTVYEFTASLGQISSQSAIGQRAMDSIARIIPFDMGGIGLFEDSNKMLLPIVVSGPLAAQAVNSQWRDALHGDRQVQGEGIVTWVAAHGQPVRIGNTVQDPRYVAWLPQVRSELCVPLRAGDRVIGVVNLESMEENAFDEHAERLLVTIANPLAIAIVNAQLYEQTQREAVVKAALLREVSHRVKNNLAAIASLVQLALQSSEEEREQILAETLSRAQSLAAAHAQLARSGEARIRVIDLASQVLQDVAGTLAPVGSEIAVHAGGDDAEISAGQLTTVALVLNELATNAVTHGFTTSPIRGGCLDFKAESPARHHLRLSLSDNGDRLSSDTPGPGLGLSLVQTLVEKDLNGVFTLERVGGWTVARVEFELQP